MVTFVLLKMVCMQKAAVPPAAHSGSSMCVLLNLSVQILRQGVCQMEI